MPGWPENERCRECWIKKAFVFEFRNAGPNLPMDALVYYKVINNVTKKCTTLQARAIVLATDNVIHNSKLMHQTDRDDVPLLAREGGGGESAASAWRNVCYVQPTESMAGHASFSKVATQPITPWGFGLDTSYTIWICLGLWVKSSGLMRWQSAY
jgi:hypothetical protein